MPEPMKIRATLYGDTAEVKVLISHPMETGQRKDAKGDIVPRHFIQSLTATLNGKLVIDAQLSQGLSRNPFLGFKVKGAKLGDKVSVTWIDNRGEKSSIETSVGPGI